MASSRGARRMSSSCSHLAGTSESGFGNLPGPRTQRAEQRTSPIPNTAGSESFRTARETGASSAASRETSRTRRAKTATSKSGTTSRATRWTAIRLLSVATSRSVPPDADICTAFRRGRLGSDDAAPVTRRMASTSGRAGRTRQQCRRANAALMVDAEIRVVPVVRTRNSFPARRRPPAFDCQRVSPLSRGSSSRIARA